MAKITPKQIHTLLSQAGIDNETYRVLLKDRFKVDSSLKLTEAQKVELVKHLNRCLNGAKKPFKPSFYRFKKPQARKIMAMWSEMYKKGIVREKNGLLGFVNRFKPLEKLEWMDMLSVPEFNKVIEGLKEMTARHEKEKAQIVEQIEAIFSQLSMEEKARKLVTACNEYGLVNLPMDFLRVFMSKVVV
ncbi:regulatory protein GemA [Beggiatoa leptomitoformis]|nr:regulatory protein GemA [Beggiatoa leptomitoformis]